MTLSLSRDNPDEVHTQSKGFPVKGTQRKLLPVKQLQRAVMDGAEFAFQLCLLITV